MHRLTGIVADWMRFMHGKMPDFTRSLLMDTTLKRWDQGVDVILREAPALVIVAYANNFSLNKITFA